MTLQTVGATNYYTQPPVGTVQPTTYYGTQTPPVGDPSSGLGTDSFQSIGSMLANAGGGGFASYKLGGKMATNVKDTYSAIKNGGGIGGFIGGVKNIAVTGLKGAGLSALVGAGVSAITNGVGVVTGKTDTSQAVSNVIGDTITSAVGGFGAVTIGGLGHLAFSAMGVAGLPLTIGTVALGAVGGVLAGKLVQSTGLVDSLKGQFAGG